MERKTWRNLDLFLNKYLTLKRQAVVGACGLALEALAGIAIYGIMNKTEAVEPSPNNIVVQQRIPAIEDKIGEDEVLLAKMIYGEARNCSKEEQIAIAYTAINRAKDGKKWNGETLREAILCPSQYSCFNEGDPNKSELMNLDYSTQAFWDCLDVAMGVLSKRYKDKLGATHYHTKSSNPYWKNSPKIKRISVPSRFKHLFYSKK